MRGREDVLKAGGGTTLDASSPTVVTLLVLARRGKEVRLTNDRDRARVDDVWLHQDDTCARRGWWDMDFLSVGVRAAGGRTEVDAIGGGEGGDGAGMTSRTVGVGTGTDLMGRSHGNGESSPSDEYRSSFIRASPRYSS